ncbi:hypothetical protein E2C01_080189 [Portunus trituberculatus]|uniref:Uncharacterized protein n=1 Tax=Portunus trituberculatus TaxID=210409 RepID=A0A5B7IVC3_PORTR|nr:hypothetical protein [Portunus trituberculatus]
MTPVLLHASVPTSHSLLPFLLSRPPSSLPSPTHYQCDYTPRSARSQITQVDLIIAAASLSSTCGEL